MESLRAFSVHEVAVTYPRALAISNECLPGEALYIHCLRKCFVSRSLLTQRLPPKMVCDSHQISRREVLLLCTQKVVVNGSVAACRSLDSIQGVDEK